MTYLAIPSALDRRLTTLAKQAHVAKNDYALHALEEFLEDQEDYFIALAQSERIEKGLERVYSYEEVLKELGCCKQ